VILSLKQLFKQEIEMLLRIGDDVVNTRYIMRVHRDFRDRTVDGRTLVNQEALTVMLRDRESIVLFDDERIVFEAWLQEHVQDITPGDEDDCFSRNSRFVHYRKAGGTLSRDDWWDLYEEMDRLRGEIFAGEAEEGETLDPADLEKRRNRIRELETKLKIPQEETISYSL
jgi:hypothetical protein